MKLRQKIEDMHVEKVLLYVFVFIVIGMMIYVKFLATTNVPQEVERIGYCKMNYGEYYENQKGINHCYSKVRDEPKYDFTDEEFRSYCPKQKFFSTSFYSDCFKNASPKSETSINYGLWLKSFGALIVFIFGAWLIFRMKRK